MNDHILPALIVFGILFAICLIGLMISNNQSRRNNATTHNPEQSRDRLDTSTQFSRTARV